MIRKDLKNENDLQEVRKLISESDIIIENFRPGKSEEWFAPWPDEAIVCNISAYGNDGPRSREGGYDIVMQARSGLMSITGDENGNTALIVAAQRGFLDIVKLLAQNGADINWKNAYGLSSLNAGMTNYWI